MAESERSKLARLPERERPQSKNHGADDPFRSLKTIQTHLRSVKQLAQTHSSAYFNSVSLLGQNESIRESVEVQLSQHKFAREKLNSEVDKALSVSERVHTKLSVQCEQSSESLNRNLEVETGLRRRLDELRSELSQWGIEVPQRNLRPVPSSSSDPDTLLEERSPALPVPTLPPVQLIRGRQQNASPFESPKRTSPVPMNSMSVQKVLHVLKDPLEYGVGNSVEWRNFERSVKDVLEARSKLVALLEDQSG